MRRADAVVVRPSVPPLAWLAAGIWVAAALAEELSWRAYAGTLPDWTAWAAAGLLAAGCAALTALCPVAAVRFAALGLAVGLLVSTLAWARWRSDASGVGEGGAREVIGQVVDDADAAFGGWRVRVRGDRGGTVVADWPEGPVPAKGSRVAFRCALHPPSAADAYGRTAVRRGDVGEGRAWSARVLGWPRGPTGALLAARARALRALERARGPGADLFASVVLGDTRRTRGSEAEQDFRVAGLGHVLGASALYVGILFAALRGGLRRLGLGLPAQLAGALAGALGYALAAGLRASMVRALVVCAVAGIASLSSRRHDALSAGSLAVAGILLTTPAAAFDLGLALGASVVLGMAIFGRLARAWVAAVLPDGLARFAGALSSAAVAQLAALPLTAASFGLLPLLGPVSVVAVVPLLAVALPAGLIAAGVGLASPPLAVPVVGACCALFGVAADAAHVLAAVPGAALAVGPLPALAAGAAVAAAVGLWAWWPQPKRRRRARAGAGMLALVLAVRLVPVPAAGARVVVMDVGQGDAILVRDGAASMLVDCGPKVPALRAALARQGVRRLDCVVLTHAHADHTAGLAGLAGVVSVGWIGAPETASADDFAAERMTAGRLSPPMPGRWRRLSAGAAWRVGRTTVRVLWPERADPTLSTNDTSVVLLLERDGFEALLLGDAEERPQQRLLDEGRPGRVDLLKVAHHGSVNGLHEAALAVWRPRVAAISVGARNDFGHPAARTLRALERTGAVVKRTDREGDVATDMTPRRPLAVRPLAPRCATIDHARRRAAALPRTATIAETDGHFRTERPEARLPHLRRRGAAPRARGPPPAGAPGQGRGP